jgi:hypothetical protein
VLLGLCLMLGAHGAAAQEAGCAPSEVGDGTGVYFLVLGESCTASQA